MSIDPTARVSPEAHIGAGVEVGPYVVVEAGVSVGDGCRLGAHAVLKKGVRLGSGVRVFEGAVLGGEPQDLKFKNEVTHLKIGDNNIFREQVTIHRSATTAEATGTLGVPSRHRLSSFFSTRGTDTAPWRLRASHCRSEPRVSIPSIVPSYYLLMKQR